MKRSPASSCSSSYSSSSSCVASESIQKPKAKRIRKTQESNQGKSQNAAANSPNKRSSIYRGVTRHRWTGRFEAHLWDKSSWNNIQNKKGKQVYLGAYDNEEAAAHTYDLAALKYWGTETTLNFPVETYTKDIEEMQKLTKEEYLASLRRQSSGFSRGVSKYRGVARHHHNGRWEARIGRVYGNKYLYLGTYNTQEEAAAAYDMAAIEYRGANAVTNFDVSNYIERLRKKGIPIDQILQEQQLSNSPIDSGVEVEAEVKQPSPPPQQQEEQEQKIILSTQLQRTQLNSSLDDTSPVVIMDPIKDSGIEVEVKQPSPPPQQEEQEQKMVSSSQLQYTQQISCLDGTSPMVVMDPIEEHELAWSFYMDSGLNLTMLDLPLENSCELPDLFDHTGFEDNIDLMFETCCYGNEAKPAGYIVETDSTRGVEEVGVTRSIDEESEHGKDILLSDSVANSPTCSTTTSVSCYYSV